MTEFYKKYRPKALADLIGQDRAVASIRKLIEKKSIPHAILLSGPSGTGKTTIGRILRRVLQCDPMDYHEKDCTSEEKPLEFIRRLRQNTSLRPMKGNCSVWFLEEFQSLSRAGFSQQALLKILEDTPEHIYFILATTDPQKINKAVLTRCYEVKLNAIAEKDMSALLSKVATSEGLSVDPEVVEAVVEAGEGSARKALVIFEQVVHLKSKEEQLQAIQSTTFNKDDAFALAKTLMFGRKGWPEVASILRNLAESDQDVEGVRYCVLAFARSCLVGKAGGMPNMQLAPKCFKVIDIFSKNFYESKQAGLAAACYEVVCS